MDFISVPSTPSAPANHARPPIVPSVLNAASEPVKIMIVEDEAIVAMDLESQLEQMGYRICATVDNSKDAIANAAKQKPDLILMDIVIKGLPDGIETARLIHHTMAIPIVFLSAHNDIKTVERAARTAPYGYLTKPFQSQELRAVIEVARYKAKLERQLRDSEQWLSSTLRCVGDAVVASDQDGKIRFMNPAAESLLGWLQADALGLDAAQVVRLAEPDSGNPSPQQIRPTNKNDGDSVLGHSNTLLCRNGRRVPIDDSVAPILDEAGVCMGTVRILRDMRERLAAIDSLKRSEARFRNVFDFAAVGMALIGLDNRFLRVNAAVCNLLGYTKNELIGVNHRSFSVQEDHLNEPALLAEILSGRTTSLQFEKRYRTKNDGTVWTLVSVSLLLQNDAAPCFLFQIHNVSERKQAEHRLAQLAHYDALTGLANRAFLSDEIERQIVRARRHQQQLAVVFLDLDHFKQINDSLGHSAGDLMLQAVAAKLKSAVRESDTVARLGGDEFVLLLAEIKSADEVLIVTNKVQAECAKPMQLAGHEISIGISLGVSLFPDDAADSSTLLQFADSALYHAKAEGRNNLQFYRPELTVRMEHRMRLGAGLRLALAHGELELHYQPIMSLATQRPMAAEALIRWNHPSMGLLLPDEFIPIAEETGLSVSIGAWVIKTACQEAARWPANRIGGERLTVAVNVSAQQVKSGDLVPIVQQALAQSGLAANRLCIEITEQLLLQDTDANLVTIAKLKALGVKIAIDDFGVGYSSLGAIRRFGPTELKLDCSLTRNVACDPDDAAIARAVIAMAHTLKLTVIAEGVETLAQEAFLHREGCDMTQGFHYYRPHSASQFRTWLGRFGNGNRQ